jgi:two-component system sensor histidine kinase/response regulator
MVALTSHPGAPATNARPATPGGGPAGAVPSLRILVVDDEPQIRTTLAMMLQHFGHRVELADDGQHALALLSQEPDLVLCDVNMPGTNGYAVLEALRKHPRLQETPFIFLTGMDDRRSMRQGMALGADDYLTKPFTIDELSGAIAACYRKHASVRHRLRQLAESRRSAGAAAWSHELLTPIHGVMGFASMLEEEAETITKEELRWMARGIRKSGERQLALAKKILRHHELVRCRDEGRVDRGCARAGTLGTAATAAAANAGRQLDVVVECADATVEAGTAWLETVATELVENACKFSPSGSPVVVRGVTAGRMYRFEVRDAGRGMTAEERGAIAPYRQFGRDKNEQQGLGLGLSLVQEIAALLGGSLRLSPGVGGTGLHVTVELPLATS